MRSFWSVALALSTIACGGGERMQPRLLSVEPTSGPRDLPVGLRILVEGFEAPNNPDKPLRNVTARLDRFMLTDPRITAAGVVEAEVPPGLPLGVYTLEVLDRTGWPAELAAGYEVRKTRCTDVADDACDSCASFEGCGCDRGGACRSSCGDGVIRAPEQCDDAGSLDGDGCSATCEIEAGFRCSGEPSTCSDRCGDGVRTAVEGCDDGNRDPGDGCDADCGREHGFECGGELGETSSCAPRCGDGERGPSEACDDGDAEPGDGCTPECATEPGFTCPEAGGGCAPTCGDGVIAGTEGCDDQNLLAGDGCDSSCGLEPGFTCPGPGRACVSVCGDAVRTRDEACDDGGVAGGDGCTAECEAELGWDCAGAECLEICGDALVVGGESCDDGARAQGDGCSDTCRIEVGFSCEVPGSPCHAVCGDGLLAGLEGCDDGNLLDGDGCGAGCGVEVGYACAAPGSSCAPICGDALLTGGEACDDGNLLDGDGCTPVCARSPGWTCAIPGAACTTLCGDGLLAGLEACDDANTLSGDGCAAGCLVERGYTCPPGGSCATVCGDAIRAGAESCDDGNLVAGDGCSGGCGVELGFVCAVEGASCAALCGDAMIVAGEGCDDGNTAGFDGCSAGCLLEPGFTCAGPGVACHTTCGDGVVAGNEVCDDGNAAALDGCAASCTLEAGYHCLQAGRPCAPICGDSVRVGAEPCDDGNTGSGDGCSASCTLEPGFVCGAPGTSCSTVCGDAIRAGLETCDDANLLPGDGCSPTCAVEAGYACTLDGLVCVEVCGDSLVIGGESCDDGDGLGGDGCSALCSVEPGFVCSAAGVSCTTVCGDGLMRGAEECDDGNSVDNDGCDAGCTLSCGNGSLDAGEECDDGNRANGDGCGSDCTLPHCGDLILVEGEECDDGNLIDGDGCDSNCTTTRCGNGVAALGEECDDGNAQGDDGCTAACAYTRAVAPISADGVYHQWTPSQTAPTHVSMLSAGCAAGTYVYTTRSGYRESFVAIVLNVPAGSIITDIEVTPCAATHTGAAATFALFYRLNDVDSPDGPSYAISGSTLTTLPATVFSGVNFPRAADSTLEIGAVLTGGVGGVRIGGLAVQLRYYSRPFPAPSSLVGTHTGLGNVELSWTDNTTWESGFRIERSVGVPGEWLLVTQTAVPDVSDRRDAWLPEDQTYFYRVRAIDAVTNTQSDWSETIRVITASHVPAAPRDLGVAGGASERLGWLDVSGNEESFEIERRIGGGAFTALASVDAGTTTYTDPACPGGCEYRVRAVNVLGPSGWSNVASSGALAGPGPDLRVTGTISGTSVVGSQTTTFNVAYANPGTTLASQVVLETTVPAGGTFQPALSDPAWQCHNGAADHNEIVLSIGRTLRSLLERYPNVKQVLISSHNWSGYVPLDGNLTEPYSYEGAFAVKRAVAAQIHQMRTGELDPLMGNVSYADGTAPWIAWAFYHWANGVHPNGYGLVWPIEDFVEDRSHLSVTGRAKVADTFMTYLLSSPWTSWFQVSTVPAPVVVPPSSRGPGNVPIIDLLPNERYYGLQGGLYENGSNTIPLDHREAGIAVAGQIQPLDEEGNPSPAGRIVMIGIGYSNSAQTMVALISAAVGDPRVRPIDDVATFPRTDFAIVNCAGAGGVSRGWADPEAPVYATCDQRLGTYSPNQVQVVWFNAANNANYTLASSLSGTVAGTRCRLPLGDLAAGAAGSAAFVVRSTFAAPTALSLGVKLYGDGATGTDAQPLDNALELGFTPSICTVPGGPGCTP